MSVRAITDDETTFFQDNGWVLLPGLVDRETVTRLHERAEQLLAAERTAPTYGPVVDRSFRAFPGGEREGAMAREMLLAPAMGRGMAQLLGVDRVRVLTNSFLLKMPEREGTHAETIYHQDFPGHPVDRSGFLTVWLALHDMPADGGVLQFYSRSHTHGSYGWVFADGIDLRQRCPRLKDANLTFPKPMKAGDATAHHSLTVHGAPPNLSPHRRWAYTTIYMDASTRYNGAQGLFPEGLRAEPHTVLDQPVFPLVPVT